MLPGVTITATRTSDNQAFTATTWDAGGYSLKLDPGTHRVSANGAPVQLGPTEYRLLKFLMARLERVHSRRQLLDQVWGDHVYIEERTIDVHITSIRKKLGSGADCIQTVRGCGYKLADHATL